MTPTPVLGVLLALSAFALATFLGWALGIVIRLEVGIDRGLSNQFTSKRDDLVSALIDHRYHSFKDSAWDVRHNRPPPCRSSSVVAMTTPFRPQFTCDLNTTEDG